MSASASSLKILTAPGIELEAQMHSPPSSDVRGLAIVAHPLGRLGGSLSDHVVQRLARLLQERSLCVVTYNSRGVGASGGKASWTGADECADAQAVLERSMHSFEKQWPEARHCGVVVCGYSAGAMYISTVRPSASLLSKPAWLNGPRPRFVLISYPISYTWALSFFRTSTYTEALRSILCTETDQPADVLVVYGLQDSFTNAAAYERWLQTLRPLCPSPMRTKDRSSSEQHPNESTLHDEAVDGADHFWSKSLAMARLVGIVQRWMEVLDERRS